MIWQRHAGIADTGREHLNKDSCDRTIDHRDIDHEDRKNGDRHDPIDLRWVRNHLESTGIRDGVDSLLRLSCSIGFCLRDDLVLDEISTRHACLFARTNGFCIQPQLRIGRDECIELGICNFCRTTNQRPACLLQSQIDVMGQASLLGSCFCTGLDRIEGRHC